jgi:2-polyprenyl-3-methyl-5-hydroxy-6-metoxy-1,4-benzoquinol methylase
MNEIKQHYDNHLSAFYAWMSGDVKERSEMFGRFLRQHQIIPASDGIAIDLGSGHGIQSIALAEAGFSVKAIDFSDHLLNELKKNSHGKKIETVNDDIRNVQRYSFSHPELIVCCGDTLTHLANFNEIEKLLEDCCEMLRTGGKIILSFRDYSTKLTGDARFIPVKSDEHRILTCFLDYQPTHVRVTDILYEKNEKGWRQKIGSYNKFRISDSEVEEILESNGMQIHFNETDGGVVTIIAGK